MAAAPLPPLSPVPPTETAPLSQGARIIDTFIAPGKTFTDIRRSASWWAPWIIMALSALLMAYAMGKQIGFEQISKNAVEHSKRADQFDKLPADQQESQLRITSKVVAFFSYFSPLLLLLYALIATLALWLTFKLALGAETSFGQAFAIVMYGWLPGVLGAILAAVSLFAGVNPDGFDPKNPVGTNVGYYLDPETTGRFLRGMLTSLDIFSIWTVVLIGIGFASTSKVKRSTAITVVAVWYLLFKLADSALNA